MSTAHIVIDATGHIVSVNTAFTKVTGYTPEEVIGEKPCVIWSDRREQNSYRELWSTLQLKGHWQGEIWNRRKTGDSFLMCLSISMVACSNSKPVRYVGFFNDITELKRKEVDMLNS